VTVVGIGGAGYVVAVAEARDQQMVLGMLYRVWSVCGQSMGWRTMTAETLWLTLSESMAMRPTARGGPRACAMPTREPAGTSAATSVLDIEGEGDVPHLVSAGC
jgi:hypothetical protein